jgi:folate-binding protein YgfZ
MPIPSTFFTHLINLGYRIEADESIPPNAAAQPPYIVPLPNLAILRAEGPDAASLLHNLLTQDIKSLSIGGEARWAALLTPKGRTLALVLLWRDAAERFFLILEASLAEPLRTTLLRYRLRSKVDFTYEDGLVTMARLPSLTPQAPFLRPVLETVGERRFLHLGPDFVLDFLPAQEVPEHFTTRLTERYAPGGTVHWRLALIRHGLPWLLPVNQEEFLPQWINLDRLGAVSFTKGCYPGQEIVTRTHYLGRVKKRMYRLGTAEGSPPQAGDECFSPVFGRQGAGRVVLSALRPEGGFELLAVLQREAAESGEVHLGSPEGAQAEILSLPYSLD